MRSDTHPDHSRHARAPTQTDVSAYGRRNGHPLTSFVQKPLCDRKGTATENLCSRPPEGRMHCSTTERRANAKAGPCPSPVGTAHLPSRSELTNQSKPSYSPSPLMADVLKIAHCLREWQARVVCQASSGSWGSAAAQRVRQRLQQLDVGAS